MRKSQNWWQERWRRQDAAAERFDKFGPKTTDGEIIAATADYLIARGSMRRPYRLHLRILNMSGDRLVSYDWRQDNAWGISTTDEARARAWIGECMRQGYGVLVSQTRNGPGTGTGSVAIIRQRRRRVFGSAERKQDAPLISAFSRNARTVRCRQC